MCCVDVRVMYKVGQGKSKKKWSSKSSIARPLPTAVGALQSCSDRAEPSIRQKQELDPANFGHQLFICKKGRVEEANEVSAEHLALAIQLRDGWERWEVEFRAKASVGSRVIRYGDLVLQCRLRPVCLNFVAFDVDLFYQERLLKSVDIDPKLFSPSSE